MPGTRRSWQLGQRKCLESETTLVLGTRPSVTVAALRFGATVGKALPFVRILTRRTYRDLRYVARIYMTSQHSAH